MSEPNNPDARNRVEKAVRSEENFNRAIGCTFTEMLRRHWDQVFEERIGAPQKIQVMESNATLRDQFAMTAMIADAVQSAIITASKLARGSTFIGEDCGLEDGAKQYYEIADAMLKARK